MDFGEALKALKAGKKITRKGWNGKGMYLYLTEGYVVPIEDWWTKSPAQEPTDLEKDRGAVEILPHIDMYTVNSSGRRARLCGWLASQTDMLSEDWEVVE
jgi:hypothetical protein